MDVQATLYATISARFAFLLARNVATRSQEILVDSIVCVEKSQSDWIHRLFSLPISGSAEGRRQQMLSETISEN